ncbi:hypothetical protein [Streptomyces sindenensis]|uniref:hypothetical protein n=1 Tax=Streptomyces sindenensis TaxID=67363 RepID=UPI0016723267|nr:hypothetical protein [Streptomyces sindenensis]GGP51446.1 hypothetical protein GCM10010231_23260 [Streptomyces sindenensis]
MLPRRLLPDTGHYAHGHLVRRVERGGAAAIAALLEVADFAVAVAAWATPVRRRLRLLRPLRQGAGAD